MARPFSSSLRSPVHAVAIGAVVATMCATLTACGSSSGGGSGSSKGKGNLIGVAFYSQDQKRYPFEANAITEEAKKNGDSVIVNYAKSSSSTQASQVESMMQRGIKVLILQSFDSKSAGAIASKAQAQGIKVIAYDTPVEGAKADYAISRNNTDLGKMHAEDALKAVPSGKYAVIRGDAANSAQKEIGQPYNDILKKDSGINIVYDVATPQWSAEQAQHEAEAALQKNPDIKVFVAMWDEAAQSVVSALKAAGKKPGEVFVTGTDASTPSLAYIAQGWQGETVWTPIDEMARDAADIAHAFAAGQKPPAPDATVDGVPRDYVKITSVTKSNLCDFITKIAPKGWVTPDEVFGAGTTECG